MPGKKEAWVELRVGPTTYMANRHARFYGLMTTTAEAPYAQSTRELNVSAGSGEAFEDGQTIPERPAAEVFETDSGLTRAIDEFATFEIERLERLSRLCQESHASLVTDEPIDWSILNLLISTDQSAKKIQQEHVPNFCFNLTSELPFLRAVSLDNLLNLREDLGDDFLRFRGTVIEMGRRRSGDDPDLWRREAQRWVHEEVDPAVAALAQRIRRAAERHANTVLGSLVAVIVTGMIAWVSHSAPILMGAPPALWPLLKSEGEYQAEFDDPMFFLLQVRETTDNGQSTPG